MDLRRAMLVCGAVAFAFGLLALPARATYGARTTADEPQYLLSAISLWEDHSLDIADELRTERWRDFHEATLPRQTEPQADGSAISPHDPLLPVLLAGPVALAGWAGAKAFLSVLAGLLAAALVWVAHRRFAVPATTAALVVGAAAVSPPLAAYATQIYPELPAGLAVTVAVGALTGPLDRRGRWTFLLAVVALPWLAVKYVPVAAALGGLALWKLWRSGGRTDGSCAEGRTGPANGRTGRADGRTGPAEGRTGRADALALAGAFVVAGAAYALAHRAIYGGWTVYASGDHFVGGELTVVGDHPNYWGRSRRLLGLLVDRDFGLLRWAPLFALAVPALAALARRRPPGAATLALPLAAGWATATWIALTMQGWWWPGRQVVVVVPLAVLAVAWWAAGVDWAPTAVAVAGAVGALSWLWLLYDVVIADDRRLIIDFAATTNPISRLWRLALPELRSPTAGDWWRYGAWLVALAIGAGYGWRRASAPEPQPIPERNIADAIPV